MRYPNASKRSRSMSPSSPHSAPSICSSTPCDDNELSEKRFRGISAMRKGTASCTLVALLLLYGVYRQYPVAGNLRVRSCTPPSTAALIGAYGDLPAVDWGGYPAKQSSHRLFSQGLYQLYNFNQLEARRNFEAALVFDNSCALCHWGIAHSYGSTVNRAMSEQECRLGWNAVQAADLEVRNYSLLQRTLLTAQRQRYMCCKPGSPSWSGRDHHFSCEKAYAAAMTAAKGSFPEDSNVLSLYADSVINLSPWDYYVMEAGTLRLDVPYQKALIAVQDALARDPTNMLALHLMIHILEPGPLVALAEEAADTLSRVTSNTELGHLRHMPAHVYNRIGRYSDSITSNEAAIRSNVHYALLCLVPYVPEHNKALLVSSALLSGRLKSALKYSNTCTESDPRSGYTLTQSFPAQKVVTSLNQNVISSDNMSYATDSGVYLLPIWTMARYIAYFVRK